MRVPLAVAILAGAMFVANAPADAARKHRRGAEPACYHVQPRHLRPAKPTCARGAWGYSRYDPVGEFRGFPGWARRTFSEGRR
jgi:hypothetical protein